MGDILVLIIMVTFLGYIPIVELIENKNVHNSGRVQW